MTTSWAPSWTLDVSYAGIAKACGMEGVQVTTMDDLTAKLNAAIKAQMEERQDHLHRGVEQQGVGRTVPSRCHEKTGCRGGNRSWPICVPQKGVAPGPHLSNGGIDLTNIHSIRRKTMQSTVNWNTYDTEEMVRGDRDYLWHHIKPHKVFQSAEQMIVVEGKGLRVKDIRGKEYLDATSGGVWSVMVGHGRESIAKAVYDQLLTLGYYAGTVGNIPTIKFAAKLIALAAQPW
jgi:hypothetical protein